MAIFAQASIVEQTCSKIINDEGLSSQDAFKFTDISVESECLKISIEYSGGCIEPDIKLVNMEKITESNLPQIYLKLIFKNYDSCKALIRKDLYFDLSGTRDEITYIKNSGIYLENEEIEKILINIEGWEKKVLFTN